MKNYLALVSAHLRHLSAKFGTIIGRRTKRVIIAITGGFVLLLGIITIPYPGPGWLTVFAGLAILSTEFDWAQRMLNRGRRQYDRWLQWLKRQNTTIRLAVMSFTFMVVIVTIWIMNGYGLIDNWLNLNQPWLHSPLLK